jgi:cysteine-rich repeat protein
MRAILGLPLLGVFLLAGPSCSTGDSPPPPPDARRDKGKRDLTTVDRGPDSRPWPDYGPKPDKGPKPDTGPKPDLGPCGNKKLDPGEACDKAITAGQPGACPSLADCDDKNKCTTDSVTGSAADCSAECSHAPIASCCGNGQVEAGEQCDDGNVSDKDGCSNACKLPGGHLVITEVAVTPGEAEFVEIYNPSATDVPLDTIYLSDRIDYFQVVKGPLTSASTDFVARFPTGAKLAPGSYLTIALQGALSFKMAYGKAPDYELKNTETAVPDLVAGATGSIGSQAGLTDGGELIVLFTWDGTSDLVKDVDYVVWKGSSASAVYKSSTICVDGPDADTTTTCYKDDTSITIQANFALSPPQQGGSIHRCDYLEGSELKSGGNGASGHDETSEPFEGVGATWKRNPNTLKQRTPGAPAPAGFCPQ